jgi:catecholate siderophore receptor
MSSRAPLARRIVPFDPLSAAVVAALAAPACAWAQSADQALPEVKVTAPDEETSFKPEITTTRGLPQMLRDVPQSITVINRAVLESQSATSLSDALRNVPGITLGAAEGGSIGNNINLRGFNARTDLYLDGIRDRGQYYRDVFALDAIEVLKGPSSMLFGRGSTGGVINQVSKLPELTPHNEVSVTAGTQPSLRTTIDVNKPLTETSAVRVSAMAQDVASTRDVMKNRDYGIAPSLRTGIGTPTEVTLSGLFLHNRDMADYGLPPVNGSPADVSRDNFYGLTDDRTLQDVGSLGLRVRHKVSSTTTLRNHLQYNRVHTDAREAGPTNVGTVAGGVFTALAGASGNPTSLPPEALSVRLTSHDRDIIDQSIYNVTDLTTEFATGALKHTLLVGAEIGRDTYRNQAYTRGNLPVVSLVQPAYTATPASSARTTGNRADASAYTIAAYANDSIDLTQQWKLVGGLRQDHYHAEITNSAPTANTPASAEQTVNHTSVRTGLIFQPTAAQSYYLAYGTSFNPSLETLTVSNGQQALEPEKNRSIEAGAKWDLFGGNLSLTSAIFQIEKTNARSQISPGVYELTGTVRVNGFELGAAGRITRKWQVFGGYTFLDAEIVSASALDATQGNVPANTPRHSAALWTTYNLTGEWEVGGGATYLSRRYVNNSNVVSVPNYVRVDATLAYHQPKYDVRLNLLNVADRTNFEALIPSDAGRSVPGIGRTLLATYTYKF